MCIGTPLSSFKLDVLAADLYVFATYWDSACGNFRLPKWRLFSDHGCVKILGDTRQTEKNRDKCAGSV